VLGAPRGGEAGGPSRVRHVTRRREGPVQWHAPGAVAPGRAHRSRGGPGRRHVGLTTQYQAAVNLIQTQISNGIKLYSNSFKLQPLQKGYS
jgi:hypothetical protein